MKKRPTFVRHEPAGRGFWTSRISVVKYANGWTAWHYDGQSQRLSDILTTGFFDAFTSELTEGDMIHISAEDGDAMGVFYESCGHVVVTVMVAVARSAGLREMAA